MKAVLHNPFPEFFFYISVFQSVMEIFILQF